MVTIPEEKADTKADPKAQVGDSEMERDTELHSEQVATTVGFMGTAKTTAQASVRDLRATARDAVCTGTQLHYVPKVVAKRADRPIWLKEIIPQG